LGSDVTLLLKMFCNVKKPFWHIQIPPLLVTGDK
jgi:hypothetical protein